jgi:DNA helicase HerA-like ATPase
MSDDNTGRVIGTKAAQPLDFWMAVDPQSFVQLDEVVAVTTPLPGASPDQPSVQHFGVVDAVEAAYEGASFHSDVFRDAEGTLPVDVSTIAHVSVTRVEPEVLVPPVPGRAVRRASQDARSLALYFDQMTFRFPAGLSRDGEPVFGNLEFLDGRRGAHVNISGISGVATKTSYALFLLYGLFHSPVLPNAHATHAIVFNVKGDDLLYIDKPNRNLTDGERARYDKLGLPAGPFQSVGLWAPARAGDIAMPDTSRTDGGVKHYYWTLREFCRDRMLRFIFADADDETSQLSFVVARVENVLADWAERSERIAPDNADLVIDGDLQVNSLTQLGKHLEDAIPDELGLRNVQPNQWNAFTRRLQQGIHGVAGLVRAEREAEAEDHRFDWRANQVSVIDINRLSDRAKRFVVGVVVRRLMQDKERTGTRDPLVFLVLDELNKYAPREGRSPIKEVVLDIAERGRSLGVVLVGAEQTASEIERRVTANASFRVVGRLDAAESHRDEYGFLTASARVRSAILKPGSMFLQQPDVPVPLLVQFPFPAWATRADEVDDANAIDVDELFQQIAKNSR